MKKNKKQSIHPSIHSPTIHLPSTRLSIIHLPTHHVSSSSHCPSYPLSPESTCHRDLCPCFPVEITELWLPQMLMDLFTPLLLTWLLKDSEAGFSTSPHPPDCSCLDTEQMVILQSLSAWLHVQRHGVPWALHWCCLG